MKKSIFFILLAFVLAFICREIIYKGVLLNNSSNVLNTAFKKHNNFNSIIIGSSRAGNHFNPIVFDSITHLDSYNIWTPGMTIPYTFATLKDYTFNSKPPRYVIMNLDIHIFNLWNTENIYPRFFPYLNNDKLYHSLLSIDKRIFFFKWIPFYSMAYFNESFFELAITGFRGVNEDTNMLFLKGFRTRIIAPKVEKDLDTINYKPFVSTPQKIEFEYLDSIIRICRENNSKLILVISPAYYKYYENISNRKELKERFGEIAKANDIPFLDYSEIPICRQKELFHNGDHLNRKGANLFSTIFANDLINYLDK